MTTASAGIGACMTKKGAGNYFSLPIQRACGSFSRGMRMMLIVICFFIILQTARIYSVATEKVFGWWFAVGVIL